jgi:hypothetical protein
LKGQAVSELLPFRRSLMLMMLLLMMMMFKVLAALEAIHNHDDAGLQIAMAQLDHIVQQRQQQAQVPSMHTALRHFQARA